MAVPPIVGRLAAWLADIEVLDELERRHAVAFQGILIFLSASVLLSRLPGIVGFGEPPELVETIVNLVLVGVCVGAVVLTRQGSFRSGVLLLGWAMLAAIAVTFLSLGLEALNLAQLTLFVVTLMVAGLVLGRRALWVTLAALSGIVVLAAFREWGTVSSVFLGEGEDASVLLNPLWFIFLVTLIVDWFGASTRAAFETATRREQELQRANNLLLSETEERKRAEQELARSERLKAVGRLAGGIAHDFNNLLTAMMGHLELARFSPSLAEDVRDHLDQIDDAANRATELTRQLLMFASRGVVEPVLLDVNRLTMRLGQLLQRVIGEDVHLITDLAPDLSSVMADPGQLEQVLMNLALNARDAMEGGGKLTIETRNVEIDEAYARLHLTARPGRYVQIAVTDTGIGMPPEVVERIFEPFFTTKGDRGGTGLGLATSHGIVEQAGGHIWVYSEPNRGTTFKIHLPAVIEPAGPREDVPAEPAEPAVPGTVLVVEDEDRIRALLVQILSTEGHRVIDAGYGTKALETAERLVHDIDLLLTDVVMPELSGRQLADRLRQSRPDLPVLYISGYTEDVALRAQLVEDQVDFLSKPFAPSVLAARVRAMLDASRRGA